jgi:hypothetical protein
MIRADMRDVGIGTVARAVTSPVRRSVVIAVLVLFLALTGALAAALNMGQDEAYSLHTSSAPNFVSAFSKGVTFEVQAPLYFGVLEVWRTVNDSVFFARLLSIACCLVALNFVWRFARRYIPGIAPEIVLAFVALNPFMIWAAVEMRPYAAAIALSTALLYYFFRGWFDDGAATRARAAFIVIAIVGAYTQYYVVTLVVGGGAAILALGQPRKFRSYFLAASIIGVALIPIAFMLPQQLKAYTVLSSPAHVRVSSVVMAIFEFLAPYHAIGGWAQNPIANVLYVLCALLTAGSLWRRLTSVGRVARGLAVIAAGLAATFAVFIVVGHIDVVFPRQGAALFAPTILAALALIGDLRPLRRPLVLRTYAAFYAVLVAFTLWSDYHAGSKSGDWKSIARLLTAQTAPSDAVAVFDAEAQLPLEYYFTSRPITPIPRPLSLETFDEDMYVIHDEREVARSLGGLSAGHRHVWLVMNDLCTWLPKYFGCAYLTAYVDRHFTIVKEFRFNQASVLELAAKK